MSFSNTLPASGKSQLLSTSEGEQSPPSNNLSSSEFSVFVNVDIGKATASGMKLRNSSNFYKPELFIPAYYASQTTLNTTVMSDDTISITSTVPSSMAPEIPRRSNSIISMASHNSFNNFDHHKPLLSPRAHQPQHHQTTASPKVLDSLSEDMRSMEFQSQDPISPSSFLKNNSHRAVARASNITLNDFNERSSPSYNSSPRHAPELNDTNGPLPISPHVNVPNAHSFNHQPPPLPPRARKKNPIEFSHSQLRQAKDAPLLLPRDKSPPPLPPRTGQTQVQNSTPNAETFIHLVSISVLSNPQDELTSIVSSEMTRFTVK